MNEMHAFELWGALKQAMRTDHVERWELLPWEGGFAVLAYRTSAKGGCYTGKHWTFSELEKMPADIFLHEILRQVRDLGEMVNARGGRGGR